MVDIQSFIKENDLNYLLINTTNEFLIEYNTLDENSLYKLTRFSGSTGRALVTGEKTYLFVDGRYHIQADMEVDHSWVEVVKLKSMADFIPELLKLVPEQSVIGIFSKKNSLSFFRYLEQNFSLKLLDVDPFDQNSGFSTLSEDEVAKCSVSCGKKAFEIANASCLKLAEDEVFYITDINDVSYMLNLRNYSKPYASQVFGRAILHKDGKIDFYKPDKFTDLRNNLLNPSHKVVIDKNSINMFDYKLLTDANIEVIEDRENPIPYCRCVKSDSEIEGLRDAFCKTDKALSAVREYIYSNSNISEYDIEKRLQEEFKKQGAKGLSFKPIVAKNKNAALAHYSKSSKDEIIQDGDLVLIDCGAYFDSGLATDITRVFVKGEPQNLQIKIYTLVLKAFLKGFNFCKNHTNVSGFEIHDSVRQFFENENCEGFVFNHGLGHGIGVNVHEAPPSLSNGTIAKNYKLRSGNCFTIEPGLYRENYFGIRLENSCYMKDGRVYSFSAMNYEKKLIDYDMLTAQEKQQLADFEVI